MLITAVSIQNKEFTVEYRYRNETRKLLIAPLRQNSREIVINKPNPETAIKFTAYVVSTGERALVNEQSTYTFRSRAYRKKAFIVVGEKCKCEIRAFAIRCSGFEIKQYIPYSCGKVLARLSSKQFRGCLLVELTVSRCDWKTMNVLASIL